MYGLTLEFFVINRPLSLPARTDYFLGVLHSRVHEIWGRHMRGTQLREVKSGFATRQPPPSKPFPFLGRPAKSPKTVHVCRLSARQPEELVDKRDAWLNPPGTSELERKDRTLTNLYNKRPAWLADVHRKLDEAVFSAYGWPSNMSDSEILESLLALNHERAAKSEN